jgi:hypothetical protein
MKALERMRNQRITAGQLLKGYKNTLKCSSGGAETIHHKICKFWIANYCWERGLGFYTEATFRGGGRADVVITDWAVVIEVLCTEDIGKFLKKDYPLSALPVSAFSKGEDIIELLDAISAFDASTDSIERQRKKFIQAFRPGEE